MQRREFFGLLSGAAAWPLAARAQQPSMPVIGFLNGGSPDGFANFAAAFRKGLGQTGMVDGQNVRIEYRWANGRYDQVPALATDLVRRQVSVIFAAGGDPSAHAAKAVTSTIPIVFIVGGDPVTSGLVPSLGRPGGNITGMMNVFAALEAKRLELLHQMVPASGTIAVMMNPSNPRAESDKAQFDAAAEKLGVRVQFIYARDLREIEAAFANAVWLQTGALHVASDPVFFGELDRLIALAAQHAIPAMYQEGSFVKAGGLMSYGTTNSDLYRQAGIYVGQILKGSKPADLPVLQPTKFELLINLKTAKALGLEVPMSILLLAEEVIE